MNGVTWQAVVDGKVAGVVSLGKSRTSSQQTDKYQYVGEMAGQGIGDIEVNNKTGIFTDPSEPVLCQNFHEIINSSCGHIEDDTVFKCDPVPF